MDTFGEWLRQQRERLHLTREQLAQRVGCSVALLRKIEDGERRPSAQIAALLANALNITPADRVTFVKVARGELRLDRLSHAAILDANAATSSASAHALVKLPVPPTSFIGRQRELAELTQLLCDTKCRLLTLVGPGGMGKTRLAIETATHIQNNFTDGVYFASFASVDTSRFITAVIADAIGFAFQGAAAIDPKTQLIGYLQDKQLLLVADNLEQLLSEPGIELLSEFLAVAPKMKVLATSRETLSLQDEWIFEVQGLPIPERADAMGSAQNTSVELFLQRARQADVKFSPSPEDDLAIIRICQLVEGMPLGIELAAAWVRTLSCDGIVQEIEQGLDFLRSTARDLPVRHRSMRAVFDHSWQCLGEEEQRVLRKLSLFRGGFRREAARAITGAKLDTLSALVTKSFVRRSGEGRYELHEVIRQFAAEQLAGHTEEHATTQAGHGRYHLALFSQADERLRSAAQRAALAELAPDMDNVRAAWNWAISHGEFGLVEPALRSFAMYYDTRGWFQEGYDLLEHAVIALEASHQPEVLERADRVALGHLLACQGLFAFRLARYEQSQMLLERSLTILRPLDESRAIVEALVYLGIVRVPAGDFGSAAELFDAGLTLADAIGDRWFAALCLTLKLDLAIVLGQSEMAYAPLQHAVTAWREIGDPRFTAMALSSLGLCALDLGRFAEARAALEESGALYELIGERSGLGLTYRGIGVVAQAQAEHQQAVEMFQKSMAIFTGLGGRQEGARVLAEMGNSLFAMGDDHEAERAWRESLRVASETRGAPVATLALAGIAHLHAKRGNLEPALELLLTVLQHPASTQDTKRRAALLKKEVEAQLTTQRVESIQARMQPRTLEEVVNDVLNTAWHA